MAQGVDRCEALVQEAQAKGLKVTRQEVLPFLLSHQGEFGAVLAFDLLEHLPREEQIPVVEAVREALRPGGVFLCTVPNANSALASRWRYNDWAPPALYRAQPRLSPPRGLSGPQVALGIRQPPLSAGSPRGPRSNGF